MKVSLWRDIRAYSKTKGRIPLDERQMDALKELYIELAKTMILGFMIFMVAYGFMDIRGQQTTIPFFTLSICFLGAITYYYMLRFCYQNVVGLDVNFEVLLIPAFVFAPYLFFHSLLYIMMALQVPSNFYYILFPFLPLMFLFVYLGANRVYKNGKLQLEKELQQGELHFRSRRLLSNYGLVALIIVCVLPISYDLLFKGLIIIASIMMLYVIYRYGFSTPNNDYILTEEGIIYQKTILGRSGGFIPYQDIKDIIIQDTLNIGYAKDKVKIIKKDDCTIFLFPENAYHFYLEISNTR